MSDPTRKRLLERTFKYTRASETDLEATFRRIRRQQKEADSIKESANVKQLKTARGKQ